MKKSEINSIFRQHVRDHLTPKGSERNFVSELYSSFQNILGHNNCIQIGSYPRFTAITPLHDLDILYIIGSHDNDTPNPTTVLNQLEQKIRAEYKNPTSYAMRIDSQTHSITVIFSDTKKDVFSIDIVPAYKNGANEFGEDMYLVPEILKAGHKNRQRIYSEAAENHRAINWIPSDPRGYIKVAQQVNENNDDFRKTVKFIKAWRSSCRSKDENFKLKSFHIEQIVSNYFVINPSIEIFDGVFQFFYELPNIISRSSIPDRADVSKHIDEYIDGLTDQQKNILIQARDAFLMKLEDLEDRSDVADLIDAEFYVRVSSSERFLFDSGIPVLIEDTLTITATALPRNGDFRKRLLDILGVIEVDRKIEFRVFMALPNVDLYKWKVRNDRNSGDPRGEITDHQTKNDPEHTKYRGKHFVECYAIKNGTCIARAKQHVVLDAWHIPRKA